MRIFTIDLRAGLVKVSIVIALKTFTNENIQAFLNSTKLLCVPHEIILVTHSLSSSAGEVLTSLSIDSHNLVKIKLVWLEKESDNGPAYDRNVGTMFANAPILLFADDDSVFLEDISSVLERLNNGDCYGIQPLILKTADTEIVDSAGEFIEAGRPIFRPSIRGYCKPLDKIAPIRSIEEVASMRGAFMLVRKDAFLAVGGFDSDYDFNYEDVDLGWRMTCAGFRQFFVPTVKAQHKGSRVSAIGIKNTDRDLKLGIVNLYMNHFKIFSYPFWPFLLISFQQEVLCHAIGRKKNGEIPYAFIFREFFFLNKMLIRRLLRVHWKKRLFGKRLLPWGLKKLEAMAIGKRYIH